MNFHTKEGGLIHIINGMQDCWSLIVDEKYRNKFIEAFYSMNLLSNKCDVSLDVIAMDETKPTRLLLVVCLSQGLRPLLH